MKKRSLHKKKKPLVFHVVSLFPETVELYAKSSILGRAQEAGLIEVRYYNPRDYTEDKWQRVDRKPYGGGPGMVLMAEPFLKIGEEILSRAKKEGRRRPTFFNFSPSGTLFTQTRARSLSKTKDIVLICGRYEGIDARVEKVLRARPLSIGSFVLTGGEVPAMSVIDAVARQVRGVLGDFESLEEERVASPDVYTRPEVLVWKSKKYAVPSVLLSGHQAKIEEWKKARQEERGEV